MAARQKRGEWVKRAGARSEEELLCEKCRPPLAKHRRQALGTLLLVATKGGAAAVSFFVAGLEGGVASGGLEVSGEWKGKRQGFRLAGEGLRGRARALFVLSNQKEGEGGASFWLAHTKKKGRAGAHCPRAPGRTPASAVTDDDCSSACRAAAAAEGAGENKGRVITAAGASVFF